MRTVVLSAPRDKTVTWSILKAMVVIVTVLLVGTWFGGVAFQRNYLTCVRSHNVATEGEDAQGHVEQGTATVCDWYKIKRHPDWTFISAAKAVVSLGWWS